MGNNSNKQLKLFFPVLMILTFFFSFVYARKGEIIENEELIADFPLFPGIAIQKKILNKNIKINEPIKTDKKTKIEVIIPNIGKILIGENTKTIFKSENLLKVDKGKIHSLVKTVHIKKANKFTVHTPLCAVVIRGTEYILNVEDDGTTTLIVLAGEVELSDINKKKTALVSKNQQVVIKPGELPSLPVQINPDQILKWWE